ncbi:hypothetical protein [Nakamurella lactea]|uniref:hypothetical protein n=1 Tax=Nakamurella lactea TaxID=459515 RepID=UPI0004206385|nr:hypothetical protein [Nakamurella lactea]
MVIEPDSIQPDTKDWTWVLDRSCPECGFDPGSVSRGNLAGRIAAALEPWPALLAADSCAVRPQPSTWSRLEYGAHVREVTQLMRRRLEQILTEDDARFANWDQDVAAVEGQYGLQNPRDVAAGIVSGGAALVTAFGSVPADAWERQGVRSNGSRFTAYTLGVYALHDLAHHVWDVTDGVPTPDGPA